MYKRQVQGRVQGLGVGAELDGEAGALAGGGVSSLGGGSIGKMCIRDRLMAVPTVISGLYGMNVQSDGMAFANTTDVYKRQGLNRSMWIQPINLPNKS